MVAENRAANPKIANGALNLTQIQQQNGQGNHMCSCFFQLRCHQSHSTFPLSQTEFAFYFYPFAFVPVILCLIPERILLWPAQSRTGQPDSSLFAVTQILTVPVNLIRQYTAGIVSLAPVEFFNHFLELCRFIVGVKGMILQPYSLWMRRAPKAN